MDILKLGNFREILMEELLSQSEMCFIYSFIYFIFIQFLYVTVQSPGNKTFI